MKEHNQPNICFTASGYLINDDKILLIKHKKLEVWLSPGGHLEEGELPHQAAQREFWEETGIKVEAIGYESDDFMQVPFKSGLHWVCKENYDRRKNNQKPLEQWKKGCEKHFDLGYIVEAVDGFDYKKNVEETDGIAWFTIEEIKQLETLEDVRKTIIKVFKLVNKKNY